MNFSFKETFANIQQMRETIALLEKNIAHLEQQFKSASQLTFANVLFNSPLNTVSSRENATELVPAKPAGRGTNEKMLQVLAGYQDGADKKTIRDHFLSRLGISLTISQASSAIDYLKRKGKVESVQFGEKTLYRLK